MRDVIIKINMRHRDKFISIVDMLDKYKEYKYTMSEKMNGNVVVNFVSDMDNLIRDFPEEKDFFIRLKRAIQVKRVLPPVKLVIIFVNGEAENNATKN